MQSQLTVASNRLAGYAAVQATLDTGKGPRRYLGMLDESGRGAVAIGNPDTASRNAVFIPGTGQGLARLSFSDEKSLAMYNATLTADPGLQPGDVAVTTWMGYDRPMDLSRAAFPQPAYGGADRLEAFENGQRASHVGAATVDTVIGHSYGSTVLGAAASHGRHLDADNIIAVGGPGMLVDRADRLDVHTHGNVYVMRAANDAISMGGVVTQLDPGRRPDRTGLRRPSTCRRPGPGRAFGLPSIGAHSSYWLDGNRR